MITDAQTKCQVIIKKITSPPTTIRLGESALEASRQYACSVSPSEVVSAALWPQCFLSIGRNCLSEAKLGDYVFHIMTIHPKINKKF